MATKKHFFNFICAGQNKLLGSRQLGPRQFGSDNLVSMSIWRVIKSGTCKSNWRIHNFGARLGKFISLLLKQTM